MVASTTGRAVYRRQGRFLLLAKENNQQSIDRVMVHNRTLIRVLFLFSSFSFRAFPRIRFLSRLNYTFNNDRNYEVSLESQSNPSGSPNTLTKQLITRSVRLSYSKLVYSFSLLSFLSLPLSG